MNVWILGFSAVMLVLASTLAFATLQWLWPDAGVRRLSAQGGAEAGDRLRPVLASWTDRLPPSWLQALGWLSRWSLPDSVQRPAPTAGATQPPESLALQLVRAGWRSRHAMGVFGASKTLLMAGLIALAWSSARLWNIAVFSQAGLLLGLSAAALGYMLPNAVLRWRIGQRQQQLFRAFPDALDMLRVCVQAGLGLDAAIERVGREMQLSSPILSEEWRLTGLELRAGASRSMALLHMAERVGLTEIDAMVTMLNQADRFGTRMSEALQVHADGLRTQRRLRAEEAAAQLPVKLLIPLIFCIFPTLLTVMLGPVGLSLYEHFTTHG